MLSTASTLGALNLMIAFLCFVYGSIHISRLRSGKLDRFGRYHSWGVVLFCVLGWGPQRLWWGINRSMEALGHCFVLTKLYASLSWITIPFMISVVIGFGFLMAPLLSTLQGDSWIHKYLISMALLWSVLAVGVL